MVKKKMEDRSIFVVSFHQKIVCYFFSRAFSVKKKFITMVFACVVVAYLIFISIMNLF